MSDVRERQTAGDADSVPAEQDTAAVRGAPIAPEGAAAEGVSAAASPVPVPLAEHALLKTETGRRPPEVSPNPTPEEPSPVVPPPPATETTAEGLPAIAPTVELPPRESVGEQLPAPAAASPVNTRSSTVIDATSEVGAEGGGAGATLVDGGDLEELVLPSSVQTLAPLPAGATVGPDARLRIERGLDARGRINRYGATWRDDAGGLVPVELREGPADHPELRREAEVLAAMRYAMLPGLLATFEQDGRRYLAIEWHEGESLERSLVLGLAPAEAVSIVLQLTQALRHLHRSGWALLGLHPADVVLGHPLRLAYVGTAVRIGQEAAGALHVAGYSAPEVAHRSVVTGREDVYTLGAVLYRALAGAPIPEQGPELAGLAATVPVPGAPQLLNTALAPVEERADLEAFYQALLAFKRRLAQASLTLQVVSGTTIGLNRTRLANEDACVYKAWSLAHDRRIAQRAVLCVVDGMGGMEAGEVASRAAVEAVLNGVAAGSQGAGREEASPPDPVVLVRAAAGAVWAAAAGRAVGATITCAVVDDGAMTLAHVGDTRAYLLRGGTLTQLTQDHSLVASMVASGVLTPEEARGHPDSNKVLRSLGGQQELADDYIDTLATAHGEPVLKLRADDRLVLCSDGVWGVLTDDALREILLDAADDPVAVRTIIRRVLEGGAPDNATLIIARCSQLPGM